MQFNFCRLCCLLGIWLVPSFTYAGALDQAVDQQVQTDIAAQRTQQQIDSLDDETRELLAEYRSVLNQKESLAAYNSQLEQLVSSQQDELVLIEEQLANIDTTQRDITPLMIKMVEVLEQFVELDTPFLPEERNSRVAQLKEMMDRADVNLSEKYRRILEAYQVELQGLGANFQFVNPLRLFVYLIIWFLSLRVLPTVMVLSESVSDLSSVLNTFCF